MPGYNGLIQAKLFDLFDCTTSMPTNLKITKYSFPLWAPLIICPQLVLYVANSLKTQPLKILKDLATSQILLKPSCLHYFHLGLSLLCSGSPLLPLFQTLIFFPPLSSRDSTAFGSCFSLPFGRTQISVPLQFFVISDYVFLVLNPWQSLRHLWCEVDVSHLLIMSSNSNSKYRWKLMTSTIGIVISFLINSEYDSKQFVYNTFCDDFYPHNLFLIGSVCP